jgi:FtsP/CotA-like multicopper oxidase with cupredoxin domain
VAAIVVGLVGSSCGPLLVPEPRPAASVAPPWAGRESGAARDFDLTVRRSEWEIAPGRTLETYTYDGRIPGPEIRVHEGDLVRVRVRNALAEPTTIHWHGVELPVGMDGVPRLSQEPIPPGGVFAYEFVAVPAGTRWYHAHFNELAQQGGGLVGALIIEPRDGSASRVDRESVLLTGELVSGDAFLVNGRQYPHVAPLVVRQGERVRLRLINAGATETQVVALAGHRLRLTHSDGNPLAAPLEAEAILLGVGERADVEFLADNPGRWQLRDLIPGHAERGLAIDVIYEAHERDPVKLPTAAIKRHVRVGDMRGPQRTDGVGPSYRLTISGGMMGSDAWTINGRSYPGTAPIEVRPGERVRLGLFNMSMEDHPMHLHGHTFQVVEVAGRSVDGPMKDTLTVRPMERYEIEFVANNPGAWLFHCHNLLHMGGGLMAEVRYR